MIFQWSVDLFPFLTFFKALPWPPVVSAGPTIPGRPSGGLPQEQRCCVCCPSSCRCGSMRPQRSSRPVRWRIPWVATGSTDAGDGDGESPRNRGFTSICRQQNGSLSTLTTWLIGFLRGKWSVTCWVVSENERLTGNKWRRKWTHRIPLASFP